MRPPRLFLLLVASTACLSRAGAAESKPVAATIQIDPSKNYGVWQGWGTSLAWWAKIFGDRDDVADVLFTTKIIPFQSKPLPGLGMTIVRYNAGACSPSRFDGRKMVVSPKMISSRQIDGFWLDGKKPDPDSLSWNWNVDANQRAMLMKARQRGVTHFELFSNSPMWWMCANDNSSGAPKATEDNLPAKNFDVFAVYLATVARRASTAWGVPFTSVAPFNEPSSSWWHAGNNQEGCHFDPATQAAFLPILRRELDKQGLQGLSIAASDETYFDHAVSTWNFFTPEIRALVSHVNVHGYQGENGNRAGLYRSVTQGDGKPIWNSEHGEGDPSGLEMARDFHHDMHDLHPVAWCYWQPLDAGGWGLIPSELETKRIRPPNPKYFVFAQYSRHIRPGMTILDASDPNTVVAYDARAQKLVIVTFNSGPARRVAYDLSRFSVPDESVPSAITEPRGKTRYTMRPGLPLKARRLEVDLPADSIQTFEISNVST